MKVNKKMKIGIDQGNYVNRYGWEKGLELMRRHGYETLDFQEFVDTDNRIFRAGAAEFASILGGYAKTCARYGIEIFQAHGPWRWPPADFTPADREERFEKMARSIEGCAHLGCRNFVIHPVMPFGDNADPDPEAFYQINFEFMNRLADVADGFGVTVCLENMPMPALRLSTPRQIFDFVKDVDRDNFKICFDTGHAAVFGLQPGAEIRKIEPGYVRVLHVHDNDGRSDLHRLPYFGVIDWKDFSAALTETGFEGSVSLETAVPPGIPEEIRGSMEIALADIARSIAGK